MKKPIVSMNVYFPSAAKKRDVKRKAKAANKSPSRFLLDLAEAVPDPPDA